MRWIAIAALVGACGSSGPDPAEVQREVDEASAQACSMSCRRPVLRGTPDDTPAKPDQDALIAKDSPVGACLERWRPAEDALYERCYLHDRRHSARCDAAPVPDDLRAQVDLVLADCGPVVAAAIARATGHAQACSPAPDLDYNDESRVNLTLLSLGTLADRAAQAEVASGHAAEGVRRMLDVIALAGDWSRGGGGVFAALVSDPVIRRTAAYVRLALPLLSPDELAEIADEVDRLAAGLPSIHDALASDEVARMSDAVHKVPANAEIVARWLRRHEAFVAACPPDATAGACVEALVALPATDDNDATPYIAGFMRHLAVEHADVYELALDIAVRRLGHCPTAADWSALAPRLAPPPLGMIMTATEESPASWRVQIPPWITLARITCARP